jgi:hypothetical protein
MPTPSVARLMIAAVLLVLAGPACGDDATTATEPQRATTSSTASSTTTTPSPTTPTTTTPTTVEAAPPTDRPATTTTTEPATDPRFDRPAWLGTRPLPLRPDGLGEIQPTPPELVDRRLATPVHLPPPGGDRFESSVREVRPRVADRSTWQEACPVTLDELRHVRVSFWGFDGGHHTGELLVHRDVADGIVEVFRRLHDARFPLEEVRITRRDELDAHPTGDGNNTGAFVCRPSVGSTSWSQHAYGLAVDLNPFHNPLDRGDVVVPELASAYLDRTDVRPGMILPGDAVTTAFAELGWGWGGDWSSSKDWMHFSANGR